MPYIFICKSLCKTQCLLVQLSHITALQGTAHYGSFSFFFFSFSAECCQQHPGTGEASAGGDSGKTTPGALPTSSTTHCRENNCKLILSSQQCPVTQTGNRHEMKCKEFCLGTRNFNLFLDSLGSQTLESPS